MTVDNKLSSIVIKRLLCKNFKDSIDIPDDLNTVPKYFRKLENNILKPPQYFENCLKDKKLADISRKNQLLLNLIVSEDFSFKKNPVLSRKRNIKNIISISILFGNKNIKCLPIEIISKISGFLINKPDKFKKIPQVINSSGFNSQCFNIIFGNLLNLGYISQDIFYHLTEISKYSRERNFTIPHPAKNSIDYLYNHGINVYDSTDKPPYIPMEKYFESKDDNRLIQDKEELKDGMSILNEISLKVFRD